MNARSAFRFLLALASASWAFAQPRSTAEVDAANLAAFERKAALAKELGATHVLITENVPPALWEFQPPNDPYPAWYIQRPDILKTFPTKEVAPFVDAAHARRIATMLEERAKVLRRLGLKAHFHSNIPQVLPEAFFTAYPHLRGPRVDQPNRARVARFSLCVDQPESVRFYVEAMKALLTRCPEIETFSFLTQDSGSGFCWVPSLYPGINGHSDCKERPQADRFATFLNALHGAAKEVGCTVEISLNPVVPRQWMTPSFGPEQLDAIVHRLPRGIAIGGREGPDGRPYNGFSSSGYGGGAFFPVLGIAVPPLNSGSRSGGGVVQTIPAEGARPERTMIRFGAQEALLDFTARLHRATAGAAARNPVEHLARVRAFAVSEVGEAHADDLLQAWIALDQAQRGLTPLDFGAMLQFGHVLNRWINRPMVPFPEELTDAEKSHYRRFLFQAKEEEQASNLVDIQAMRMFEGWGAKMLFQRVIETVVPDVRAALTRIERIRDAATDAKAKESWTLFGRRLEALICLLHSADNMVAYQAQLDRVKTLNVKPEPNPVLGVQSSWDRTDLMETARKEIDNTVRLMRLLGTTPELILDLAPTPEEETIMRLGPDLPAQLKRKIDVMNAHWADYDRLFTRPNP